MDNLSTTLMVLGVLFLIGFVTDGLGRLTRLPRVTLLLLFGVVIGPGVLDLLPRLGDEWFAAVADMALVMVGFLLGEKLTISSLRQSGHLVLWISLAVVMATATVLTVGLMVIGVPFALALVFGGVTAATDPAATADVVHENRADGPFTWALLGIVAIDDAWGLVIFSLTLATAQALAGEGGSLAVLLTGAWEVGGALLVGIGLDIPMAFATGRVRPGEPTLAEALGVVLLCGGLALYLEVSFLFAAMVMGTVVANLAHHHERPFHAIEGIEWPFMILFFVLAGASLSFESLNRMGLVGAAYVLLRVGGRWIGGWLGGTIRHAEPVLCRWMGLALTPQAGVALGMGLVATQRLPGLSKTILPVIIAATIFFEVVGPVLTRMALVRAGETQAQKG